MGALFLRQLSAIAEPSLAPVFLLGAASAIPSARLDKGLLDVGLFSLLLVLSIALGGLLRAHWLNYTSGCCRSWF
ncbi:MAG TPA: hypothetical protein VFY81_08415 [Gammaproteobacteria bacterium]|nr:hypothetical protein [Gammaproteobacteria bacterium]